MMQKSLVLSIYESSLLSGAGLSLDEAWQAIAHIHTEPEVCSLFKALHDDLLSGHPSFEPFKSSGMAIGDQTIACYFSELAANTGMYEKCWSDMAVAFLLKGRLGNTPPAEADVRLGSYLLSAGDDIAGHSLRTEMHTWSDSPLWQLPQTPAILEFPEEWWGVFTIDSGSVDFPPTISLILKNALMSGLLESLIPDTAKRWTRFRQAADQVFPTQ
jgi:hypothetical protein